MKNTARSRKIMRHPTRVLIRHRSGNIRDHPQRYHINVGKKYAGVFLRTEGNIRRKNTQYRIIQREYFPNDQVAYLKRQKDGVYTINMGSVYDSGYDRWYMLQSTNVSDAKRKFKEFVSIWKKFYSGKMDIEDVYDTLSDKDIYLLDMSEVEERCMEYYLDKRSKSGHYRASSLKKSLPSEIKGAFKRKPYDIYAVQSYLERIGSDIDDIDYEGYDIYTIYKKGCDQPIYVRGSKLLEIVAQESKKKGNLNVKGLSGHYRIKGWKKVSDHKWYYERKLPTGFTQRVEVNIHQFPVGRKNSWVVQIGSNDARGLYVNKHNLSYEDALKFAVDWMKKHPNGV